MPKNKFVFLDLWFPKKIDIVGTKFHQTRKNKSNLLAEIIKTIQKCRSSNVAKNIAVKPHYNKDMSKRRIQKRFLHCQSFLPVWILLTKSKRTVFTIYVQGTVKMPVGSKITKSNYLFVPRSSNNAK